VAIGHGQGWCSMNHCNPITAARVDLVVNLLRRSLDPAAHIGEATNAAQKFAQIARREKVTFDTLADAIIPPSHRIPPAPKPEPPIECSMAMPFGKHCGEMLGDIGVDDPGYLAWMVRSLNDETLADAARIVLEYLRGGKGAEEKRHPPQERSAGHHRQWSSDAGCHG
jgi:hypothetical protein